jgi:hypothetical protein
MAAATLAMVLLLQVLQLVAILLQSWEAVTLDCGWLLVVAR